MAPLNSSLGNKNETPSQKEKEKEKEKEKSLLVLRSKKRVVLELFTDHLLFPLET